jgi:hypothetical protein
MRLQIFQDPDSKPDQCFFFHPPPQRLVSGNKPQCIAIIEDHLKAKFHTNSEFFMCQLISS